MRTIPFTAEEIKQLKDSGKYKKDCPELHRKRNIILNPIRSKSYRNAGGKKKYYALPKADRLKIRAETREKHIREQMKQAEVAAYIKRPVYPSVKESRKKIPRPVSEKNPGGFVYIFKDRMKPDGYYKIGSTHDLNDRLSSGRTWGAIELVTYFETSDRKKLERDVHNLLDKWNVKEYDIGREWFEISEDLVINKIKELINENFNYAIAS